MYIHNKLDDMQTNMDNCKKQQKIDHQRLSEILQKMPLIRTTKYISY